MGHFGGPAADDPRFDTIAVVDWSGGNRQRASPKADAIWTCLVRDGVDGVPLYHRDREGVTGCLKTLIEGEIAAGRRLLLGFDFPFGYPDGFAARLTGKADPFAVWDWFTARFSDGPKANNRFDLAGEINALFPGEGPFWFNGLKREIAGLPRRKPQAPSIAPHRRADGDANAFSPFQMGGAGAVGGQVVTGLAALAGLRQRFAGAIRVWPFEPLDAPVALVEAWPSLIAGAIAAARTDGEIKDAAQVRVLARAIWRLQERGRIARALAAPEDARREEGWIFGLGCREELADCAG